MEKLNFLQTKISHVFFLPGVPGGIDILLQSPISRGGEFSRTHDISPADI